MTGTDYLLSKMKLTLEITEELQKLQDILESVVLKAEENVRKYRIGHLSKEDVVTAITEYEKAKTKIK